eukprot:1102042-Rhodomonas_salina.1
MVQGPGLVWALGSRLSALGSRLQGFAVTCGHVSHFFLFWSRAGAEPPGGGHALHGRRPGSLVLNSTAKSNANSRIPGTNCTEPALSCIQVGFRCAR